VADDLMVGRVLGCLLWALVGGWLVLMAVAFLIGMGLAS
jgi:hypothetical protein